MESTESSKQMKSLKVYIIKLEYKIGKKLWKSQIQVHLRNVIIRKVNHKLILKFLRLWSFYLGSRSTCKLRTVDKRQIAKFVFGPQDCQGVFN